MKRPAKRSPEKKDPVFVILDPGSTHDGSFNKAKTLVKIAADNGADAVKFQLLTKNEEVSRNIGMEWDWLPDLIQLGADLKIEVFASVFSLDGIEWAHACGCESVKFAYSKQQLFLAYNTDMFNKVYYSTDAMKFNASYGTSLYCIPEYPVKYIVDFEGIFPRFDGFSDHTLGIKQTLTAVKAGARYIEKHFQGDWHSDTPDGCFALKPKLLGELMRKIK